MRIEVFINTELLGYEKNYKLANKLGISPAMLSKYRSGETKHPSRTLAKEVYNQYNIVLWPYSLEGVTDD